MLIALGLIASAPLALAEESCTGSGPQLAKNEIEKRLADQGYVKIRGLELHHGCYEAKGFDKDGKRFEIEVNAYTGEIANRE